jgi:disulfide oxidoreductase YuzD
MKYIPIMATKDCAFCSKYPHQRDHTYYCREVLSRSFSELQINLK